jgi:anthranilate phosphoribosyltransferase
LGEVESPQLLLGGDAGANAVRIEAILSGAETGAARDMIVLNAAAALHVAGKAGTLQEGIALAKESIDSGAAIRTLELLRQASSSAALS